MKKRFTKYHTGKDKTSAQFFSIGVGKLLGPADLLLEKDLTILTISLGVAGQKKKDFKILSFTYVIGEILPTLTIERMASQVFDRSVFIFFK